MPFWVALLCCLLVAVYCGLISWYYRAWRSLPDFRPGAAVVRGDAGSRVRITVLIPARNEEANIGRCLQSLAAQRYPRDLFEVVLIDDHSTDGTAAIVKGFSALAVHYLPLAEISGAENVRAHKKFAIETGIGVAAGELIVTTDADCVAGPGWLSTLADCYKQRGAKFIAAPVRIGGLAERAHSLLGIFQTLDFITLQGITGAAVGKRIHSMCNGANLAYPKAVFLEVGGFQGIDEIPSGDDMLLMHKIFLKYPERVFFLKSPEAIVSTRPETRWKAFFHQRIRWASKADRYDDKRIFWVLLLVYFVNLLFLALAVAACWNWGWGLLGLVLLIPKTSAEYCFVRDVAIFFEQSRLMVYFPFLQPLHILYTVIAGWLGKFGSYRWKDRKIVK
ncbi:MAG TPA: glycosyltransferase [Puia sp.]|jgi:cellulose synthase/poly-beta-1,6-N-acetylglucosamine synthase-like glycosyltransferase